MWRVSLYKFIVLIYSWCLVFAGSGVSLPSDQKLWVWDSAHHHLQEVCRHLWAQWMKQGLCVPYCPGQAPMGACSSSAKNWGWAVTRRRCLNGPTIYTQAATQDAELATRGYWIDLHRHFACASLRPARWWKMLYCARKRTDFYPHRQASAAFVTYSAWISCRKLRMLQMRLWTGVCETLMPDVMLAEAHQNDHSYVHELSGPI